ncbi:ABC transporter permease [Anaerococcus urinomassiliensis]|uniref:ABC transporter permease n=1 Tax=Anaerococcus urinomassiliensis TaxID=1745712 RepID=UPI00093D6D8E|nr:iron export ABC transporter permease subunit FetB [Anaerococcus urinomassiliensis]
MNESVMNISNSQLMLTYLFALIAMLITSFNGINRNKDIVVGTLRMTVQLFIAGFILVYIFDRASFILSALMIVVMEFFAIFNIITNKKGKLNSGLKRTLILAQVIGTIFTLAFFLIIVVRPKPIYNPQYLIPLGGMIIGNSMTGINLALNQMLESIENNRSSIEGSLMLGASPRMAMDKIIQNAFDTAITPTLNSIKNMGIISLPGMMTGQILGGVSPLIAIRYQIAIMTAIMSSVAICVFIFLHLGYKNFFNDQKQLVKIQ